MKESRYNVWVERGGSAYVYNGISGSLLAMPAGDRRALERALSGDLTDCSTELVRELALGRMLVADDADELALLEARYVHSRHDQSSFALTIVTSLGCNFDCPYCFEAKHPSIVDAEVEGAILAMLDDQLERVSQFSVGWFGGEPLVGKAPLLRLSDEFIERCDAAGVVYDADIRTNGYLLSAETCRELHDRRVTTLQVTLDGPPDVHDAMRPLAGTSRDRGTFWRIIDNLQHAVELFDVRVRVNVDTENIARVDDLFQILVDEGFAGRLTVYAAQLLDDVDDRLAPANTYPTRAFTISEFAAAEIEFDRAALSFGLSEASLPRPTGAPCPAVRANEFVVGSKGELYKCLGSVGSEFAVIGNVKEYTELNGRLRRWMAYNPFADDECRSCIALPVCMGGCAQHGMQLDRRENRCDAFRYNYRERVRDFVDVPVAVGNPATRAASASTQR